MGAQLASVPRAVGLVLLLTALFTAVTAQTAEPPLTVEECVRRALSVPSAVSIARRDREIADRDRAQVRAGFLPQSVASFGSVYTSPSRQDRSTFSFVAANGIREYVGLANIFQEIDTSGRIRAEYARAKAGQDAATASLAITERDLKRAVAAAYYRLLLARHLVDVIRSALAESESFERRARLLSDAGEAARADVVKASTQVAFLRQSLASAELAATLANQDLAAFWTREVEQSLNVVDTFAQSLPEPEPSPPASLPFLRRFEFRLFEAQQRGFQAESRRERAGLFPQLSWTFQYGLDVNRVAWSNRGYTAFATLNVPIFDWFQSVNAGRQFSLRAAQVADNRSISERRFSQEYQSALARVKQFYEQVSQSKTQVALAEEDLNLSRVRYEGGEGAALDVVVAQNQLAQARTNYFSSIANYLNARLDLEVASGR